MGISVANSFSYVHAKNIRSRMWFDKVIEIIELVQGLCPTW